MRQSKAKTITSWVLQVLLGLLFLVASLGKLGGGPEVVEMFRNWGFPDKFYLLIGVLELAGGIGLLIPRTAGYAAAGLFAVMIGAAGTHLVNGEGLDVLRPIVFMLPLAGIVFLRRPWPLSEGS